MVWSKDLAKLKQDLKAQEGSSLSSPPVPSAKPSPPPVVPKTLEEEDALFLTTVGKAVTVALKGHEVPEEPDGFKDAMFQLKGIKPKKSDIPVSAEPRDAPLEQLVSHPEADGKDVVIPPEFDSMELSEQDDNDQDDNIESPKKSPVKIQLAAGMVIEVDGVLDLRNHTVEDARERLKERVFDGVFLGWRTLHVILGNSESLNQAFIDYINSPQSHPLTRYAQAPVPMGGTQAWVLYYTLQHNKLENK